MSEGSRFGIVLVLLLFVVVITIASPFQLADPWLTPAVQGAAVLVALGGVVRGATPWVVSIGIVLLSIGAAALAGSDLYRGLTDIFNAAVLITLPLIVIYGLRRDLTVSVQSVLGAVCVYLVIGMFYASVDSGISRMNGQRFFAQPFNASSSSYMYFSFITLTTVGYGDLTPGSGPARALAVSEALLGQLYLVTVIALLVGNFGQRRSRRAAADATSD